MERSQEMPEIPAERQRAVQKWALLLAMAEDSELPAGCIKVGIVLVDALNQEGVTWWSEEDLAHRTHQTIRNVRRAVERLAGRGYFEVTASHGRGNARTYRWGEKRTFVSSFVTRKKRTAPSSFPQEKGTSLSQKEDISVHKKRTAMSSLPLNDTSEITAGNSAQPRTSRTTSTNLIEAGFEQFWAAFPSQRRFAKAKAFAKYRSIITGKHTTREELLDAVKRYANSRDVKCGYACNPLKWLQEERWTVDYPDPLHDLKQQELARLEARRWAKEEAARREREEAKRVTRLACGLPEHDGLPGGPIIDATPIATSVTDPGEPHEGISR